MVKSHFAVQSSGQAVKVKVKISLTLILAVNMCGSDHPLHFQSWKVVCRYVFSSCCIW